MTDDSLCDIQMDRLDGLIIKDDLEFECSNDQDKLVHNLGYNDPGTYPLCDV